MKTKVVSTMVALRPITRLNVMRGTTSQLFPTNYPSISSLRFQLQALFSSTPEDTSSSSSAQSAPPTPSKPSTLKRNSFNPGSLVYNGRSLFPSSRRTSRSRYASSIMYLVNDQPHSLTVSSTTQPLPDSFLNSPFYEDHSKIPSNSSTIHSSIIDTPPSGQIHHIDSSSLLKQAKFLNKPTSKAETESTLPLVSERIISLLSDDSNSIKNKQRKQQQTTFLYRLLCSDKRLHNRWNLISKAFPSKDSGHLSSNAPTQSSSSNENSNSSSPDEATSSEAPSTPSNSSESSSPPPAPTFLSSSLPLYPKLFALPLYRKPAFPGFYQILQIQDQEVIDFLMDLKKTHGQNYVGGFFVRTENFEDDTNTNTTTEDGDPSSPPYTNHQQQMSQAILRRDAGRVRSVDDLHTTGSVLHLLNISPHTHLRGGQVIVMPHKRIRRTTEQKSSLESTSSSTQTLTLNADNTQEDSNSSDSVAHSSSNNQSSTISEVENPTPLPSVHVEYIQDDLARFDVNDIHKALHLEIIATMKDLLKTSFFYKEHFDQIVRFYNLDYPHKLIDLVAGMSLSKGEELQPILEEQNIEKRLRLVLEIAKKDLEFTKLQIQVKNQVEEKATKEQRRYILMEQLKLIKRELGLEKDDKTSILQKFKEKLNERIGGMSPEIRTSIEDEINRFSTLDPTSSEYNLSRTYLEWLTCLPWGIHTEDNRDIKKAEDVLNEDHFGLKDVKDRILELIAVNVLRQDTQGKIVCLVGPPGVGKTSIGKSIARALDRKFYQFSLGGLSDVAELHGHRRTYVGSMPGKLIQALKHTQSSNPVILLDEIDKLGRDMRGDPASALLEILDPSQNSSFRDHYLDVPVDLSKVLFVCTANTSDTIPGPLLDRLEVIRLAGYIFEEKLEIANQYLIPQTKESTGVKVDQISIEDDVLPKLVKDYSREAGVRNLLKLIEKIYRKAALEIVRGSETPIKISFENLTKFVGQPYFQSDRLYSETPPGVVMGLAWTQMGGATLYVEATGRLITNEEASSNASNSNFKEGLIGSFKVTGQLGSVMNESSQIALTFSRTFLKKIQPQNSFLDQAHIHLHVPEGATPKDGPSAGVTMATSLISLATGKSVKNDVAMTGELTLTGKVLKIGGVKEKVIAAKREKANILIFPSSNQRDFLELEDQIKADLDVYFADNFEDVYKIALA